MRIDGRVVNSNVQNSNNDLPAPRSKEQQELTASFPPQNKQDRIAGEVLTEEQVISTIEKANEKIQYNNTRLEFLIHDKTHEIMVKVYQDDQVVREIPSEKILDMVAQMLEMAGLLVDETV